MHKFSIKQQKEGFKINRFTKLIILCVVSVLTVLVSVFCCSYNNDNEYKATNSTTSSSTTTEPHNTTISEITMVSLTTISEQISETIKPQKISTTKKTTQVQTSLEFPLTYSDDTCNITITKEWYGSSDIGAYCYAAHIQFADYSRLKTDCANGSYSNGYETTKHAHNRLNAILTVNGCHSSPDNNNPVMRNGVVYNNRPCDVPAVYNSYTGLLVNPEIEGFSEQTLSETFNSKKATDTFCFLPPYLIGEETFKFGGDKSRAQRTFIGTNGKPGDIWIVVSEGRYVDGNSAGLTYVESAEFLKSKGCTFGVPLDGGGSSTMVFQGKVLNHLPNGKQRAVVDFLYFK